MWQGRQTRAIFKVSFKARSCPKQIACAVAQGLQCSCQWPRQGSEAQMLAVQPKLGRFSIWILSRHSAAAQAARIFSCSAFPHTTFPKALFLQTLPWTVSPLTLCLHFIGRWPVTSFKKSIKDHISPVWTSLLLLHTRRTVCSWGGKGGYNFPLTHCCPWDR